MRAYTYLVMLIVALQPAYASIPNETISKWRNDAQQKYTASMKSVFVSFWDKEYRNYHLHEVVRNLIGEIDNQEMLAFLTAKGVKPDLNDILTSDNLISYLRHKRIGSESAFAWIDLLKGNPGFIKAVLDWQTIQKEYGFEFVPTYFLLYDARLETTRDAEVWSDLFKTTYEALPENDERHRSLLLLCLMRHVWGELDAVVPPASERFAFLAEEIKTQKSIATPHSQLLAFNLYAANIVSQQYANAAGYSMMLRPKTTSLLLTFLAQCLAKDLPGAKITFAEIEAFPNQDAEVIRACRETLKELERIETESNNSVDHISGSR